MPARAFTGAAGGAACGDLVRVSLQIDPSDPTGTVVDAGFDAHGCGAAIAAGSATVALVRGTPLLDAARVGADEIADELGGLSAAKRHAAELAADALHRALGGAARAQAQLAPVAQRTVVAMSGGVDSAVAALLTARAGREVVGVTLELWSDPENDGDRSCCSAQAVRGAREAAHRMGTPHFSIDLREEFRAGVVEHWLAGHAAGETPNPCVRCNGDVRLEAMLELGEGWAANARDGPLRARGRAILLADARCDPVKDQSYVLSGLSPSRSRGCAFRSGRCTSARCARWPSARDSRWRASPTPRICAFSRARACRAFWSATASCAQSQGGSSISRAASWELTGGIAHHDRSAPRARDRGAASRCTCSRPTPSRTPLRSARARRCSRALWRCAR